METRIEQTILKNLIQSEEFTRKCVPFIKSEYFADTEERTVFNEIYDYFQKYTKPLVWPIILHDINKSKLF